MIPTLKLQSLLSNLDSNIQTMQARKRDHMEAARVADHQLIGMTAQRTMIADLLDLSLEYDVKVGKGADTDARQTVWGPDGKEANPVADRDGRPVQL